jgi:hypothetical protein
MTAQPEPAVPEAAPVTVILDPRVAYSGYGPDDGDLADAAATFGVTEAMEDLADAAEQLDHAYRRVWTEVASDAVPDVLWDVQAPTHQTVDGRTSPARLATPSCPDGVKAEVLDAISAAIQVRAGYADGERTRWSVLRDGQLVASASAPWTLRTIQEAGVAQLAGRIADDGDLIRDVQHDDVTLRLYAPTGELPADRDAIGYVLADHDTVVFAGFDFHPSPLHAVDSDATVEALAEFLALRPGDVEDDFFAHYTDSQREWIDGDGPDRIRGLIESLPGDTEHNRLATHDAAAWRGHERGPVRLWTVTPTSHTGLPAAQVFADSADNASAQYPGYLSAWRADTDHYIDDDLVPAVTADLCEPGTGGQPLVLSRVPGQHTLDWAIEHVNHWQVDATVPVANTPTDLVVNVPATGCATVALCHARAVAHDGARVDAHQRTQVTALAGSHVTIHPGACVDRRPGSDTHLAKPPSPAGLRDGNARRALEDVVQR